jgi:pyruvate/2-oxoacid:ferredoxin oxidoreductase alpha subunit
MISVHEKSKIMTGDEAAAYGAKLSKVKVVSAYPITPQTVIVEKIADMISNNEMNAKFIEVESEHSAMASIMASELTGVRSFTASSSQGILYMHEMLHWVAGLRLPALMSVVNRAIGPPWNIWADQSDTINQRDTGWMQIYCESNQEALDSIIFGYKIAENRNVLLPLMNMLDAFTLSHTSEPVTLRDEEISADYLGDLKLEFSVNTDRPMGYGSLVAPEGPFMEMKKDMRDSMYGARDVIKNETKKFNETFNATLPGLVENFMMEDADYALITMGAMSSTAKYTVRKLRREGKKVGLIRLFFYRPFPDEEILQAVRDLKGVGIVERSVSFGQMGALYEDVASSLFGRIDVPAKDYVVGIGGRDIRVEDYEKMFEGLLKENNGIEWVNTGGR